MQGQDRPGRNGECHPLRPAQLSLEGQHCTKQICSMKKMVNILLFQGHCRIGTHTIASDVLLLPLPTHTTMIPALS